MRGKKYSCKQLALMVIAAGALALPGAANAVTNVDVGAGGTLNTAGAADTLTIDATAGVFVHDDVLVAPVAGVVITPGSGTGLPGLQYTDSTSPGELKVWTVTNINAFTSTATTTGGGAAILNTGDVTLSGASTSTSVATVDEATLITICNDTLGCGLTPYGDVISTSTGISGKWDDNSLMFIPGGPTFVTTTAVGSGGSLTVAGTTTLNNTLDVDSNGGTAGGGQIHVNDTQVSITGGTASTTLALDDAGMHVSDSTNGPTFMVDNVGNATIYGTASIGGALDMNGNQINNVADGTLDTDAATKGQMDAADTILQDNIDAEEAARKVADDLEAIARDLADKELQENINDEADKRAASDEVLQDNIDQEVIDRIADVDEEEADRIAADEVLQGNIDEEVADRSDLIRREEDGTIHIGTDSLIIDEPEVTIPEQNQQLRLSASQGKDIVIDGGNDFVVEGQSQFGNTLTVAPIDQGEVVTIDEDDNGTLPGIENDEDTSTVYTQTGSVAVQTENSEGGGVVLETNGNASLLKPDTEGVQADYLQVTTFLVDNDTGLAIPDTEERIGGYLDDSDVFVELGALDDDGLLDLSTLTPEQLAAISSPIDTEGGGNLLVEGNGQVDGNLTVDGGIYMKTGEDVEGDPIYDKVATHQELDNASEQLEDMIDHESSARMDADNHLQKQVTDTSDRLDQVGAMSAAFSALVPNHKAPGNSQLSVGLGYYESEGAMAVGFFHNFSDNLLLNIGGSASFSDFEAAGRIGLTYGW